MRYFFRYWLPMFAQMTLIFFLSSQSTFPQEIPVWMFYFDKAVHAILFGLLCFLLLRAWVAGEWAKTTNLTFSLSILFTTLYGVSDEIHQRFVPGRTPSLGDVTADAAGAILVCLAIWAIQLRRLPEDNVIL
ncbi:MAG: VanZ family protein [Candidatus Omnitrophota bacterium]